MRGSTVVHCAATSGNTESAKYLLELLPEARRKQVVLMRNRDDETVLHCAGSSCFGNSYNYAAFMKTVLSLYPEKQRLRILSMQDDCGNTLLCQASSIFQTVMDLLPESQHLRAVCTADMDGDTLLHNLAKTNSYDCFQDLLTILSLLPESQRWQAVKQRDQNGDTVLQLVADDNDRAKIFKLLPKLKRKLKKIRIRKRLHSCTVSDTEEAVQDREQSPAESKRQRSSPEISQPEDEPP